MKILPVLAVAVALAVTGCSKSVAADDVESKISDLYEEQVGEAPTSVSCDEDLPAEVDAKITCDIETSQGENIPTDVTVESVDGSDVQFRIEPQTTG